MRHLIACLLVAAAACAQTPDRLYPALERLGNLGLIPTQIHGIRPWSALECRRQVAEARANAELLSDGSETLEEARALLAGIEAELAPERGLHVDSVYARVGAIAGAPLADGWHFGQTWVNDLGRPFGRGANVVTGLAASGEWGRYFAAVNAEAQRAPAPPWYGADGDRLTARMDGIPYTARSAPADVTRGRVLEAYAGLRLGNVEMSVGRKRLRWGPTHDAPLSFSDNAEPTTNFRLASARPFRLPGFWGRLGVIQLDTAIGKLRGHSYTWNPWFNAQKASFRFEGGLEVGFTRWSIFWGDGHPKTVASVFRNLFSVSSSAANGFFDPKDPGDRKGGFDFRWPLPGLSRWVVLYSDAYSEDDPSPLAAPRRAALSPGVHLPQLPGLHRLDLRVEAVSTQPLGSRKNLNYYNNQYRSGNTNDGIPMGSWIGRAGRAVEAFSTYRFSTFRRVEFSYRHLKGNSSFTPGGATDTRGGATFTTPLRGRVWLELFVQVQRYSIPAIGPPRRNLSAWMAVSWHPEGCLAGCKN